MGKEKAYCQNGMMDLFNESLYTFCHEPTGQFCAVIITTDLHIAIKSEITNNNDRLTN